MTIEVRKIPVKTSEDVRLTDEFVRAAIDDFGSESVDTSSYAIHGIEDARGLSNRLHSHPESPISLIATGKILLEASGRLPYQAAEAYMTGVNQFIDKNEAATQEDNQ